MRYLYLVIALLIAVPAAAAVGAPAGPLTVAQAHDPDGVIQASLAPDGRSVALLFFDGTGYDLQFYFPLTGINRGFHLQGGVKENVTGKILTPRNVTWAGNDLLVLDYGNLAISVDRRGRVVEDRLGTEVIGRLNWSDPESPWLLVYNDLARNEIALVNARSGARKILQRPAGRLVRSAFDRQGLLRAVTLVTDEGPAATPVVSNWYLPSADAAWQKLATFDIDAERWEPAYVPDEPNTLAVYARLDRDTYAYFSYDTVRRTIGTMLAGHPTEDILAVRGMDPNGYQMVATGGMRIEQVWLNGTWAGVQQAVDKALPGRTNRLSGNPRGKVLVLSISDIRPNEWYLLDMEKSTMSRVAQGRPGLEHIPMRPMEEMRYAADDGLSIPAFLTRPSDGATHAPLVVLIHGGPWVRDYWGWNEEVQLLAARGYTVFQPQFRGSAGFGKRFEQAGYGQWGLAMQDDITAGVRHLVAQGIADPARICIVGASYGGYAALWGLAKTPELYRCGVSFAGVTDIEHMFNDNSDRVRDQAGRALSLKRIGDVDAHPQQFDQVSPLKQASRIKAPVLLVHGEADERVPISHGLKMKAALEHLGKPVRWLSFEDEGHGLRQVDHLNQYYETMLDFLDENIGPRAATPAAATE